MSSSSHREPKAKSEKPEDDRNRTASSSIVAGAADERITAQQPPLPDRLGGAPRAGRV
jgi:hypothetical protein